MNADQLESARANCEAIVDLALEKSPFPSKTN
jgi:hypothetical protein